jgi:tRNA (guanine26-N2/guanine27-N2)-dimethyltransferase
MKREADGRRLKQGKRILRLLSLVREESEASATYYVIDKICDKLNLPVPPLIEVMDDIKRAGFQATPTHFNSRGVRTNAPANVVKEAITKLAT